MTTMSGVATTDRGASDGAALTPMERTLLVHGTRVNAPMGDAELARRLAAVQAAMAEHGVDALFVHNHTEGLGGATRWFADLPAGGGYPTSLVVPATGRMTMISHGPIGGDRPIAPGDPVLRGVERVLSTASFCSVSSNAHYDSDLALLALRDLAPRRVGFVALSQIPYPMVDGIKRGLPGVEFVDFSEQIDVLKAVKSPVEQDFIRATARLQDEAIAFGFAFAKPGMRESQVTAAVQQFCNERGSESGQYMAGSASAGEPAMFQLRHTQERVIQPGDSLTLNIENSGPGGYYSHVGRIGLFAPPPARLREEFELALAAQQLCVDMFRPGVAAADIFAAYSGFLADHGRPPERRLFCHGQGYDLVERPLIRDDETMLLAAGMHIGCHPMWIHEGMFVYLCDNYLLGPDGADRIHTTPQQIMELG